MRLRPHAASPSNLAWRWSSEYLTSHAGSVKPGTTRKGKAMTDNDLIHELKPLLFPSREIRRGELNGEIRSRVRELVAAQPQPVVPGPLPTGELEPGVRVWKSACGDLTVTAVTDFVGNTLWRNHSKALSATWPSKPVRKDHFVECQIITPPIKEPEPIPPKPAMRVIVLAASTMRPNNFRWWEHCVGAVWKSTDGAALSAKYLEPAQHDDPEHLAGLEVLRRQQGGE